MAKRILLVTLSLAVGLAFFNVNAVRAQSIMDGKLTGTITEAAGDPLPGVKVAEGLTTKDVRLVLRKGGFVKGVVVDGSVRDLSGILISCGAEPDPETLEKAAEKMVPIFRTTLPTFEVVGRLYQLGITGER